MLKINSIVLDLFLQEFEQIIVSQTNIIRLGDFNITHFYNKVVQDPQTVTIFIDIMNIKQVSAVFNFVKRYFYYDKLGIITYFTFFIMIIGFVEVA